jgi:hypothetical protein
MGGSVLHRHLQLDPGEELVEADAEVGQDDDQGRDRRHRPSTLDRAHEGPRERRTDRCLTQARGTPTPSEFVSDGSSEVTVSVLQNS